MYKMQSQVFIVISMVFLTKTNANHVLDRQKHPQPNAGAYLQLKRDVLDTVYDGSFWNAHRTTGSWTVCTCMKSYGTVMTKRGDEWNCNTPAEVGCEYSLGTNSATNIHIITNASHSAKLFTGTDELTSIFKIFIWNRRYGIGTGAKGCW